MKKTLATLAALGLAGSAIAGEPQELTAPGPQGELAGTLIAPDEGQPVLLIVPGSGPTDRDGNSPMGVTAAPYRMLAEALAERGIGSVRIDKRGMFASKAAIPDANDVTIADYADDVHAWVDSAREATGADCIWVLGHSEGGLVALEAALRGGDLCGVILVASMGRKAGDVLRAQLEANPANAFLLDDAKAAIAALEAGQDVSVEGMHPALQGLFAPQVQGFLKDMMARDPAAMAANVELPMLVVAGGRDIQTPVVDGETLAQAQPASEFVVIPDMNHVLKSVDSDDRMANMATYADSALPISPELVEVVVGFVTGPEAEAGRP